VSPAGTGWTGRAGRSGLPTIRGMARGWRWGSRPLVPASAEEHRALPRGPREFSTAWARTPVVRQFRAVAQGAGLKPLVWSEVAPAVAGVESLVGLRGPVVFVANHSSHLDAPLVLCSLPPLWRRETLVAAAADYFFEDWWRAVGTALIFGTVPLDRTGGASATVGSSGAPSSARPATTPYGLLDEGWSLLLFPEGTRSVDGQMSGFKTGAARLSIGAGAPVVPIGIRGSFAAMPRGRSWPIAGRPRVAVRFGPAMRALPGEGAKRFTNRISAEIARLANEDETTWWQSLQGAGKRTPLQSDPAIAQWRRVWASTAPVPDRDRATPWD
jgi:1-acyl-sn-glycerol-3-phosphate acyltransferase